MAAFLERSGCAKAAAAFREEAGGRGLLSLAAADDGGEAPQNGKASTKKKGKKA